MLATNPTSSDHFRVVAAQVNVALDSTHLALHGKAFLKDVHQLARDYAAYVIAGEKAIHAIGLVKRCITELTQPGELSPFHAIFGKLTLKSLCYQQALPIIQSAYTDV